jgi:hypothetical protein
MSSGTYWQSDEGRRWPRGTGAVMSVAVPVALFICLQLAAWILGIAGTAHGRSPHETASRLCSETALLVLLIGLVRIVLKVRPFRRPT